MVTKQQFEMLEGTEATIELRNKVLSFILYGEITFTEGGYATFHPSVNGCHAGTIHFDHKMVKSITKLNDGSYLVTLRSNVR